MPGRGCNPAARSCGILVRDALDLHGLVRMQAHLSQTVGGWKHWLLKPFDPIFAKDGAGLEAKIAIEGDAHHPAFHMAK